MKFNMSTPEEFLETVIELLEFKRFKIDHILEGTGSDEGRDIEAHSFETDCSGETDKVKWWIELKFRKNEKSNLGVKDLSNKIRQASGRNVKKYLLITNTLLTSKFIDNITKIAVEERIDLRVWNREKIKQFIVVKKNNDTRQINKAILSDRLDELKLLTNLIESGTRNAICIYGAGGVGKSALCRYILYFYSNSYSCGLIDVRIKNDMGLHFKLLANQFLNQGIKTFFSTSSNVQMTEQERMRLFTSHCSTHKTLLLIDNFEEFVDESGKVENSLILELIKFFLTHNMNGSMLLITSRTNILDKKMTAEETFLNYKLDGWNIDFVYDEYLPYLQYLETRLNTITDKEKKRKEYLSVFKGNPLALKVANQLCIHYDLKKLVTFVTKEGTDAAKILIDALSDELSEKQILALNRFSQFKRPLSKIEVLKFICNEETLESLRIRELIEVLDTKESQFQIHPFTAERFSLSDDLDRRKRIVESLIRKLRAYIKKSKFGPESVYNHGLLRQVVDMYIRLNSYENAALLIIEIGTRAVSMGDIEYLEEVSRKVRGRVSRLAAAKLMKVEGHIYDFTGNFRAARNVYHNMLQEGIKIKNNWVKAAGLNGLGSMERFQGNLEKAISLYTESLQVRLINGDLVGQSNSFHNLGAVYLELKNLREAQKCLESALAIRKKVGDKFRMSATQLYLGECYIHLKNFDDARAIIDACIKLKESFNDPLGLLWARLTRIKVDIIDLPKKKRSALEGNLDWCKNHSELLHQARARLLTLVFLGCSDYLLERDVHKALANFVEALKIAQSLNHPDHIAVIKSLTKIIMSGETHDSVKKTIQRSMFDFKI